MNFNNIDEIQNEGFSGFLDINTLMLTECAQVPKIKGIYLILIKDNQPQFLNKSVGGHFKGRNPTVNLHELKSNWVNDTVVIYIGQAGGGSSNATLYSRLKQYMRFGEGDPVGHWGGRYIWQLANHRDLIVCWKPTVRDDPRMIEKRLIQEFINIYNKRPFANLRD